MLKPFVDGKSLLSDFELAAQNRYETAFNVLVGKHADYGPHNIGRSPGGPLNGLAVRLHDKVSRLAHLVGHDRDFPPRNESLRDTMLDIANYGIIGMMVIDGKWPSE